MWGHGTNSPPRVPPVVSAAILVLISPLLTAPQAARPDSQPATSLISLIHQLEAVQPRSRSAEQRALLTGLQFCRAVAQADAEGTGELMDPIGYQPLPLEGPLSDPPPRPQRSGRVSTFVHTRPRASIDALPAATVELLKRKELGQRFPGVARWMLADDYALVLQPRRGEAPTWVRCECCLVMRIRNGRALVVGGNLFDALP